MGFVGYPNVGKSSVINSLVGRRVAEVSSQPGCTKKLKTVKLDGKIKIIDSPGVLMDFSNPVSLLLINSLKMD